MFIYITGIILTTTDSSIVLFIYNTYSNKDGFISFLQQGDQGYSSFLAEVLTADNLEWYIIK